MAAQLDDEALLRQVIAAVRSLPRAQRQVVELCLLDPSRTGLHLAVTLVDTLRLEHDENGSTATVTRQASTAARLPTGSDLSERPSAQTVPLLVLEQPSAPRPQIRVDGPVDAGTVAEFGRTAGAAGTRALTRRRPAPVARAAS